MPTKYNFLESLEKIEQYVDKRVDKNVSPTIPRPAEIVDQAIGRVYGTVLSVRYDWSETAKNLDVETKLTACSAFVSEVCAICKANFSCRDIVVGDDLILSVYNTSLKTEVNEVIDDLARIRSLAAIVEKKAGLPYGTLQVRLSACYGQLNMSVVEYSSVYRRYRWGGRTWKQAISLSGQAKANRILINRVVWNNLTEGNQKLFRLLDVDKEEIYEGSIVNVAMNNWLLSK